MKNIYIIKAKNNNYISSCYFNKVGVAMKVAKEIGLGINDYEILELTQYTD